MARENGLFSYVHTNTHTLQSKYIQLNTFSSVYDPRLSCGITGVWFVTLETVGPVHSLVTQLLYTHTRTQGISRIN